jgi:hypothetical protein
MYLVVASSLIVTVCEVHIPQRSGIEVLPCLRSPTVNRPAMERIAVFRGPNGRALVFKERADCRYSEQMASALARNFE